MSAIKYDGDGKRLGSTDDYVGEFLRLLDESIADVGAARVSLLVGGGLRFAPRELEEIVVAAGERGVTVEWPEFVDGVHIIERPA